MTVFQPRASQVATCAPDGASDQRYLGQVGHVGGLNYSYAIPGGCDNMTCTLMQPPLKRDIAINPGRIVRVYRGGSVVWEGKMNEPVPVSNGWSLQAYGNGRYGDDFMSYHTNYGVAGDPVIKAVSGIPAGRASLRWALPAAWPSGLYLQQPPDSASVPITDYMNNITGPAGFLWYVGRGNLLSVFTPPTVATRLLVTSSPAARTLAGYFTWLWLRYQSKAQQATAGGTGAAQYALTSVNNPGQQNRHGAKETYGDLSSVGQMGSGGAQGIGSSLMAKYQAANYAGPFQVQPGQLLNAGGVPVDLGCEQAGTVIRLLVASGGYGGDVSPAPPVQFLCGAYAYNDENDTASITPWLGAAGDLSSLLSNYTTLHAPKTPQSSWAIDYHP